MLPPYAELHCLSNFSFLRGASHPEELVERSHALGYAALAITDECSLAGAVRAHLAAKEIGLRLLIGSELALVPHVGSNGIADLWTGPGSLVYDAPSEVDPWYRIPVREIVACHSGTFDAVLGHGRILKEM